MTNTFTLRAGIVPGEIKNYGIETGTTLGQLLAIAELPTSGYDVRVDGTVVTDMNVVLPESTQLVVLAKLIKGNSEPVVIKAGMIPGEIKEYSVEEGTTVQELLELAGLSSTGYDIRIDSVNVQLDDVIEQGNRLLTLAKMIKGNK